MSRKVDAEGGNIEVTFSDGKDGMQSVITFLCADGNDGAVRFVRTDDQAKVHYFEWRTTTVCAPVELDCTRTFEDKTYDLSSLIRHDGNYVAHTYDDNFFYINICHRIIAEGDAENCPAGAAACMVTGSGPSKEYLSLGRLSSSEPAISRMGKIIHITYTDGDVCPQDPSRKFSTVILMSCNPDRKVLGELEVARQSTDCRQDFILESSAACPLDESSSAKPTVHEHCEYIGGLYTSTLKKQYVIESDDHTYYLNFCGGSGTKQKCKGQDFGVCQVSKDSGHEEVLAGMPTTRSQFVDSRILYNYTDGATCMHDPKHSKRNVLLFLYCNQYADSNSLPVFHHEDPNDCTYHIYWPRPELCRTDKIECAVSHNGHIVDLSALSDETNYAQALTALGPEYYKKVYLVSVCKPLLLDTSNRCPGAAVCETDNSDATLPKDLGFINEGLKVIGKGDDWKIQLVYNTTTPCTQFPESNISSIIIFSCGGTKGAPMLKNADGCTYTFEWETSEACHDNEDFAPSADCTIKHTQTDTIIDLKPFKGETYEDDGYKIRVCESIPSNERGDCTADSAVCETSPGTSAGKSSTLQLSRHDDEVILQYSGGSSCRSSDGEGTIVTMIQFVCDPTAGKGSPKLQLTFDSCLVKFYWKTSYVCVPDCQFYYLGQLYDFRHLTSLNSPYVVTTDVYTYTINICKDLKMQSAGTCISAMKDGQEHTIALTSTLVPHYLDEGKLQLTYYATDKTVCKSQSDTPEVIFTLICANQLGQPRFVKQYDNCTFAFEWETYVACADNARSNVTITSDGQFTDPMTKLQYSIAPHWTNRVDITSGEYTFSFSLNKPFADEAALNPHCTDGETHVCQYKDNFNRALGKTTGNYYYQDEQLFIVLNSDSICGRISTTNAQALINFICNENAADDSKPEFVDETHSCRYLFTWETPALCQPVSSSAATSNNANKLSPGIVAAIVLAVLLSVALIIGIVIYKRKTRRRWDGVYEYTGISNDDDTTSLVSANRGAGPRFYDDDDEDLII